MQITTYILTFLLALSGFLVGLALKKIAKSEIKQGKLYFIWMQNILLILAAIFIVYSFKPNLLLFLGIGLIIMGAITYFKPKAVIGYALLLILFLLSIKNTNLLILISSLTFLYGFPSAALQK